MKEQPSNPCEKVSFILTYDQLEAAYNIYREQFISCDFIRRSMERLEERIGLCNLPYETLRDDPSLLTPCGLIIGEKLEDGEPFETETDVLERFRDCGYPAATLKELELMFDADELIIFEFTNPYLDLEQKNACA